MRNEFPYNMKVKTEWEKMNKEWNILIHEDKIDCDNRKCKQCEWYDYCEFYQIKEECE